MRATLFLILLGCSFPLLAANPAYTTKTLEQLAVYPESKAVAQVVPDNESRIAAELNARIDAIPVKVGQSVRKGDALVRLDARQFELALEQAASQVDLLGNRYKLAQLQFEQTRSLHESKFVSGQALEQRRTELAVIDSELKIARNAVRQAKLSLEKTTIRAPFAGVVRERLAGEGEMASSGQPIMTLVEHGKNEVRARVAVHEIAQLQAAPKVAFIQGEQRYPVKIVRIAPVVDARAQTREVVVTADKPLLSGSSGELTWTSARPYLPAAYIQQYQQRLGVWLEEAGKPKFKAAPNAQAGRPLAVDWPLATRIIDNGRFALAGAAAQSDK